MSQEPTIVLSGGPTAVESGRAIMESISCYPRLPSPLTIMIYDRIQHPHECAGAILMSLRMPDPFARRYQVARASLQQWWDACTGYNWRCRGQWNGERMLRS